MNKKADDVFRERQLLRRKRRRIPHFMSGRERRWIPPLPSVLAMGIVNIFRPRRTEPPGPEPLDEFGLPQTWRHDEIDETLLEHSRAHWERFESWCELNDGTAFPADPYTCFDFLCAMWDRGPELYETWRAISQRHNAFYWHMDADSVQKMRLYLGLLVRPDGTIEILPGDLDD